MALEAHFQVELGPLSLRAELSIDDEIVAILGPNGAGKTTLLRAIAGLVPVDAGHISIDGRQLDDPDLGIFIPPGQRSIGMVFQDYLLFPFLSARENVAFGLRSRNVPKREARRRADEWLDRFGLADRGGSRPTELSGGQAQRVALARAVATEPRVLLLDEPLAALDAGSRAEVRNELRIWLSRVPGAHLLVTHDPIDAATLCDRLVILEGGRVVQKGSMQEISMSPRSRYVADLVGLNFYRGSATRGLVHLQGPGGTIAIADNAIEGPVFLAIHPRAVTLQIGDATVSARNQWRGRVVALDHLGDRVRVNVEGIVSIVAEITAESARDLGVVKGREVVATVKAAEVRVYAA